MYDGASNRYLLSHASGHAAACDIFVVHHRELFEDAMHAFLQAISRDAIQQPKVLNHLPGGHAIVDGRIAGDETNTVPDFIGVRANVEAVDASHSAGWLQNRAENAQSRCLAAPLGPNRPKISPGLAEKLMLSIALNGPEIESGRLWSDPRLQSCDNSTASMGAELASVSGRRGSPITIASD